MTIEVNEISIQIHVSERAGHSVGAASEEDVRNAPEYDQNEIVNECVRRVMHALKFQRER